MWCCWWMGVGQCSLCIHVNPVWLGHSGWRLHLHCGKTTYNQALHMSSRHWNGSPQRGDTRQYEQFGLLSPYSEIWCRLILSLRNFCFVILFVWKHCNRLHMNYTAAKYLHLFEVFLALFFREREKENDTYLWGLKFPLTRNSESLFSFPLRDYAFHVKARKLISLIHWKRCSIEIPINQKSCHYPNAHILMLIWSPNP